MNRSRLEYLRKVIHDDAIKLETSHKCGKTIATSQLASDMMSRLEEVIKAILDERQ